VPERSGTSGFSRQKQASVRLLKKQFDKLREPIHNHIMSKTTATKKTKRSPIEVFASNVRYEMGMATGQENAWAAIPLDVMVRFVVSTWAVPTNLSVEQAVVDLCDESCSAAFVMTGEA
jgi:hypothetical protein